MTAGDKCAVRSEYLLAHIQTNTHAHTHRESILSPIHTHQK